MRERERERGSARSERERSRERPTDKIQRKRQKHRYRHMQRHTRDLRSTHLCFSAIYFNHLGTRHSIHEHKQMYLHAKETTRDLRAHTGAQKSSHSTAKLCAFLRSISTIWAHAIEFTNKKRRIYMPKRPWSRHQCAVGAVFHCIHIHRRWV